MIKMEYAEKTLSVLDIFNRLTCISEKLAIQDLNKASFNEKRFYEQDLAFLIDLILGSHQEGIVLASFGHLSELTDIPTGFMSPIWIRRIKFLRYFLFEGCNATEAAIKIGYSPRSAKKQGYRLLKKSGELCRQEDIAERTERERKGGC